MERRTFDTVKAGLHSDFKMSKQMPPGEEGDQKEI